MKLRTRAGGPCYDTTAKLASETKVAWGPARPAPWLKTLGTEGFPEVFFAW